MFGQLTDLFAVIGLLSSLMIIAIIIATITTNSSVNKYKKILNEYRLCMNATPAYSVYKRCLILENIIKREIKEYHKNRNNKLKNFISEGVNFEHFHEEEQRLSTLEVLEVRLKDRIKALKETLIDT